MSSYFAGNILNYDRKTLLFCAESPLSKQIPTAWSADWKQVIAENPTLLRKHVLLHQSSGSGVIVPETPSHGLNIEQAPAFPDFVRSQDESPQPNSHASQVYMDTSLSKPVIASTTRAVAKSGNKADNNNNNSIHGKYYPTGTTRVWDETTEKWIEAGGETQLSEDHPKFLTSLHK